MEALENFEVTSVIGSGSYGTCYRGKHKSSPKEYIWKAINFTHMHEEQKQQLLSEVELLSQLRHPNIVQYHNHIIDSFSKTLYVVMDYYTGGDLAKVLKQCSDSSQYLEELFIWRILYQVTLALNACRNLGCQIVFQRKIKPSSVFLDSECNIKLAIFGTVRILEEHIDRSVPEFINRRYCKKPEVSVLGRLINEVCTLKPHTKFNKIPNFYSEDLQKMVDLLLDVNHQQNSSLDVVLTHPTVLRNTKKHITTIFKTVMPPEESSSCVKLEEKFNENLRMHLDNIRNREEALKQREEQLIEREKLLAKREQKIALLERQANKKLTQVKQPFVENKLTFKHKSYDDLDTTIYADAEDISILRTSAKLCENILRPNSFVRSKSERRVHFSGRNAAENSDSVVYKEYNFFNDNNQAVEDNRKNSKKHFSLKVFRALGSKRSNSNSSLGSKSSSNDSEVISVRPISWTEENKKCAFTLLKMMNTEANKENVISKVPHTKM